MCKLCENIYTQDVEICVSCQTIQNINKEKYNKSYFRSFSCNRNREQNIKTIILEGKGYTLDFNNHIILEIFRHLINLDKYFFYNRDCSYCKGYDFEYFENNLVDGDTIMLIENQMICIVITSINGDEYTIKRNNADRFRNIVGHAMAVREKYQDNHNIKFVIDGKTVDLNESIYKYCKNGKQPVITGIISAN